MKKETRTVREYYHQNKLVFILGHVNARIARKPLNLHNHGNMVEFVYVVKGSQSYNVNGTDYTVNKGDVFFTFPNEVHGTGSHPEEISEIYYMIIDMEMLSSIGVFSASDEYDAVRRQLSDSNRVYKSSSGLHGLFKQLMIRLTKNDIHHDTLIRNSLSEVMISLFTPRNAGYNKSEVSIKSSIEYIHSHICEPIHVSELNDLEHMSLSAYNRAFARIMGISPGEYILKCKIDKAKELLTSTDLSVTDISFGLGFSSSQYFATVFKRFCYTSPSLYRKARIKKIENS